MSPTSLGTLVVSQASHSLRMGECCIGCLDKIEGETGGWLSL